MVYLRANAQAGSGVAGTARHRAILLTQKKMGELVVVGKRLKSLSAGWSCERRTMSTAIQGEVDGMLRQAAAP
ncbi:hypothetical protein ACFWP5_04260 [Streptomyces sp. NPDC058469]|uniref:hypothetical protein n=1 Tax=Streptomyces sp. NPDC058469 TaxID=3346514 RepID=UPI003651A08B